MASFTDEIKRWNPDIMYTFQPDDVVIDYDTTLPYGINPSAGFIFGRTNADTFIPRLYRQSTQLQSVDYKYYGNQISASELWNENDASLSLGYNDTIFNGNTYYYKRNDLYDEQAAFNRSQVFYFQLQAAAPTDIVKYQVTDFDNIDDYIVMAYDRRDPNRSFTFTQTFNNDGEYEYWSGAFSPDQLGISLDEGNIRIALVNPRTGEIYDSWTYLFVRNSVMTVGTNCDIYVSPVSSPFNIYNQAPFIDAPFDDNTKPQIDQIRATYLGVNYVLRKTTPNGDNPNIRVHNLLTIRVKKRKLENRSYEYGTGSMASVPIRMMQFMHFDVTLTPNGNLNFINRATGLTQVTEQLSPTGSALICVKCEYVVRTANFTTNVFDYDLKYTFNINNGGEKVIIYTYTGNKISFKDRGFGDVINSIPLFDNLPIVFGQMPTSNKTSTLNYNVNFDGYNKTMPIINKMQVLSASNKIYIDNLTVFYDMAMYDYFYDLYYSTFEQNKLVIDDSLYSYWGCETLSRDMLSTPNRFPSVNSVNNTYSEMKLLYKAGGSFNVEDVYHRVVKGCINFNNTIGQSNISNTWNKSNSYFLNFWFRSTQTTEGCIISDYQAETPESRGLYLGFDNNGILTFITNGITKKLPTVIINDGQWHMISISSQLYAGTTNNINRIFVDGIYKDNITVPLYSSSNKISYNSQLYFMGHPLHNCVNGSLSRVSMYTLTGVDNIVKLLYRGDIEHLIRGFIYLRNVPYKTLIRIYNNRTGELVSSVYSDDVTGEFRYRNYQDYDVYIMVMDYRNNYGTFQMVGPIEPSAVIDLLN